jgi:hypothetical protein
MPSVAFVLKGGPFHEGQKEGGRITGGAVQGSVQKSSLVCQQAKELLAATRAPASWEGGYFASLPHASSRALRGLFEQCVVCHVVRETKYSIPLLSGF